MESRAAGYVRLRMIGRQPRRWEIAFLALAAILSLPLVGVWMSGQPIRPYLEFPPQTRFVQHEPFSLPVFLVIATLIAATVGPLLVCVLGAGRHPITSTGHDSKLGTPPVQSAKGGAMPGRSLSSLRTAGRFPSWGWAAVGWTAIAWTLAWTRFEWMGELQLHTFTPLWLGYIAVMNALTLGRIDSCLMCRQPWTFVLLFPLSATFWWIFEYLNRFVQNWYYLGGREFTAVEYALLATLPFSTVLPAVVSTAEWLSTHPRICSGLQHEWRLRMTGSRPGGWMMTAAASIGLLGIGLMPNYLFPLVWMAPLLLITGLQQGLGEDTVLTGAMTGDWRLPWLWGLAALICGFFWEMWNVGSLAHWEYAIPFVHRFELFEMPLLGYAGYLPFGLECLAVVQLLLPTLRLPWLLESSRDRPSPMSRFS